MTDDDEIFAVTIPPGTLERHGSRFLLPRPFGGLEAAMLALRGTREARLTLRTEPLDLSRADRSDHMVTVGLASGTFRASHTRLWVARGDRLVPGGH